MTQPHPESTAATSLGVFVFAFLALLALHFPLLRLPYFWDEAGYYVPAARDLLLTGSFIPHTTPSNAHPPLVMAWLALWWKIFGYAPIVTRTAMLAISAFALTGLFRLARRLANVDVAVASVICTALYPVFFAPKLHGARGYGRRRIHLLGPRRLLRRELGRDGFLVFARRTCQRNRHPRAGSIVRLGDCSVVFRPIFSSCHSERSGIARARAIPRSRGTCFFCPQTSRAHKPHRPPRALVRLPLRAHRIRLRQSRIFPLQRRRHHQPASDFSRAPHASLPNSGIHESFRSHTSGGIRHAPSCSQRWR